ncbi:MAG: HAD-IA family hydrolase [Gammaproteobacteria bacterium]|nr:HAD-IA family hydrolase [Gammaproteobacteria bacterium]
MIRALLLDLGNVVVEIDFRRVFDYWATQANVEVDRLYDRWSLDDPYKRHEVGEIDFATYIHSLEQKLEIKLTMEHWLTGWNTLFIATFPEVRARLQRVASSLPVFAFTNTNPTHQQYWNQQFPEALVRFRKIYVSSEIGLRKPDVAAYDYVARDMGFHADEILFVDDSRSNIDGARAAGMITEWVKSEADVVNVLDRVLDSTNLKNW